MDKYNLFNYYPLYADALYYKSADMKDARINLMQFILDDILLSGSLCEKKGLPLKLHKIYFFLLRSMLLFSIPFWIFLVVIAVSEYIDNDIFFGCFVVLTIPAAIFILLFTAVIICFAVFRRKLLNYYLGSYWPRCTEYPDDLREEAALAGFSMFFNDEEFKECDYSSDFLSAVYEYWDIAAQQSDSIMERKRMKNIFGIDVTDNKENGSFDGECFVVRKLSMSTEDAVNNAVKSINSFEKMASLPLGLEIVYWICLMAGVIILLAELKTGFNIRQTLENAPCILYIGAAAWITVIYLAIYKRLKAKGISDSDDFEEHMSNISNVTFAAMSELGIPSASQSIDVIAVKYKYKDDNKKSVNIHPMFSHWNLDMFIFTEREMLCLADLYNVYEIPISSIRSIELCSKKAMLPQWNKEEPYNSPKYKQYKIVMNNQGIYFVRYYKVIISDAKGDFELLIPNYDQLLFSEITNVYPD